MHRYVDLHYQYLTSSYACMLSCPISLRPFVILEGTGLGPWGAQGQRDEGIVSPAPMWGEWFLAIYCRQYATECAKLIAVDLICYPGRNMFLNMYWTYILIYIYIFFKTKQVFPPSSLVRNHTFPICQISERISVWFSFTRNYALNVIV